MSATAPPPPRPLSPSARAHDDGVVEVFGIQLLDVRRRIIGSLKISVGCLTASLVHPREVFGPAIAHKAAAIVAFLDHPSGDPEPSAEDLALTAISLLAAPRAYDP